jgi:hypothetical protein
LFLSRKTPRGADALLFGILMGTRLSYTRRCPVPKWETIHAFPRYMEERSLAEWSPGEDVHAAVLAVADAVLEIVETHALLPRNVQAFIRSVELPEPDPRAWRPGSFRLLQAARLFPEVAGETLTSLLNQPRAAARLLAACQNDVQLTDVERERAFEALLAAPADARIEALQGEALRTVRIKAQHRESERFPRSASDVLRDLEAHLDPAADDLPPGMREAGVVLSELVRVLEPDHLDQVLGWLERWPKDDFGGFLPDVAQVIADVEGGHAALVESFQRQPTLAVSDYLEYRCEGLNAHPLFVEALKRNDLPDSLRRDLAGFLEDD